MLFSLLPILTVVFALVLVANNPSPADIQGFNNIIALAIAPVDYLIGREIKGAGLDPITKPISASISKQQNIGLCNAIIDINYNVTNIKGISSVAVDHLDIIKAEKSSNGAVTLTLAANIKPIDLSADVNGHLNAQCGVVKPHIDFIGDLLAERIYLAFQIEVLALPLPTGDWVFNATVANVTTDFKDVLVHLQGFNKIFNPLLDFVIRAIENKFKQQIESTLDSQITGKVNALIQKQLEKLWRTFLESILVLH